MLKPISELVKSINKESSDLLVNRYKIGNMLGQGAMGQVYKAFDSKNNDTVVAIKFLSQALLNQKMCDRFEKEAKISALLGEQSNHIVKVKDYGIDSSKVPFYVMEYLKGDDLEKWIKSKPLSLPKFLSLTRQICLGLECAHNGILVNNELAPIIHRDIKPSNIFLMKDETNGDVVKILDFGIAQIRNPDQSSTQQRFMGTPEYSSPEQMAEDELKATSDIYSLGVLMFQMLTTQVPIKAESKNFQSWYRAHHEFIPKKLPSYLQLPKDLENLIMKCLAKSPQQRPQTIKEILRVIIPLDREYNSTVKDEEVQPSNSSTKKNLLPIETIYDQSSWPSNKPQRKIVFPHLTEAKEGTFVSLWTMLENTEVYFLREKSTFCFTHFMYQTQPHPMILWVNLLYSRGREPKWLPCYLDVKTDMGYQISINLINQAKHYILLFEMGNPQKYQRQLAVEINRDKVEKLQNFVVKTSSWNGDRQAETSKVILKKQFEAVKNTILTAVHKAR